MVGVQRLGQSRADAATRTLAAYLHKQGSIIKTVQRLCLYRTAMADPRHHRTAGRGLR
jgi:hypothetical protein